MPAEPLLTVTDETFAALVLNSPVPTIVDFWAAWCPPCGPMTRVLAELATELGPGVRITTLDVDTNPRTTLEYRVHSMPTLLFFTAGTLTNTLIGARPKSLLRQTIHTAQTPYTNAN
ncbi:thioredoxin family protein [Actinoplanes sp. CA-015351]|uniref:thioredoxin family protein n=1 Tax=Actinoplanes sp. CA-015351 TaxID=3239897 RepID=UPI003D98525A